MFLIVQCFTASIFKHVNPYRVIQQSVFHDHIKPMTESFNLS